MVPARPGLLRMGWNYPRKDVKRMAREPLILPPLLKRRLAEALREDAAWHDVTTLSCVPARSRARGAIVAKGSGVVAGLPVVGFLFSRMDRNCRFHPRVEEGTAVSPGRVVARIDGPARVLLSAERTALNFLSRLSGVATMARRLSRMAGKGRLYDTRKTTPLWRLLERYAVRVGGGMNHRFDLSSQVLLKDNHLALAGGVAEAIHRVRRRLGRRAVIEVEVETLEQAREAIAGGADILLVDNATPSRVRRVQAMARGRVILEVSGGIGPDNIARYSRLGVQRLSSGALTHSAPGLDFSLDLKPA